MASMPPRWNFCQMALACCALMPTVSAAAFVGHPPLAKADDLLAQFILRLGTECPGIDLFHAHKIRKIDVKININYL
jgi:hypothetical protein